MCKPCWDMVNTVAWVFMAFFILTPNLIKNKITEFRVLYCMFIHVITPFSLPSDTCPNCEHFP